MKIFGIIVVALLMLSCGEETLVKPKGLLHLEYPEPEYKEQNIDCPFRLVTNIHATAIKKENCWIDLVYPNMKASVHLTYHQVNNNIDSLLYDVQKLTFNHTIKASSIFEQARVDSVKNVYGMLYMINGNAATSTQFYVTDSTRHFLAGALYFNTRPNFDSIKPAINHIREDIRVLMENVVWE